MFDKTMKVALIHIRYVYKGGLETRLFNYIEYFLSRGDEVHLFTSKIAPEIVPPKHLHIHLIDLKHFLKPVRNFFFDKRLKKELNRDDFDFILSLERTSHQNHVIAPSTHQGYLEAKGKRFYDLVDFLQLYLDKKAFRSAKVIYACSQMVKNEIISYYKIPPDDIKVLYPPINLKQFQGKNQLTAFKLKHKLQEEDKLFLLVSTSHKRKGLDLLVKVFKSLPSNYKLLVAGTAFESTNPQIISLGFVKEMAEVYEVAHVLLHPAVYEPFGQIITEAFAAHVPVIVSSKVGAKELISPERGLVLGSLSPELWKEAILNLNMETFSFEGIDELLADLALDSHMKKMLNWAILKK